MHGSFDVLLTLGRILGSDYGSFKNAFSVAFTTFSRERSQESTSQGRMIICVNGADPFICS